MDKATFLSFPNLSATNSPIREGLILIDLGGTSTLDRIGVHATADVLLLLYLDRDSLMQTIKDLVPFYFHYRGLHIPAG